MLHSGHYIVFQWKFLFLFFQLFKELIDRKCLSQQDLSFSGLSRPPGTLNRRFPAYTAFHNNVPNCGIGA